MPSGTWETTHNGGSLHGSVAYGLQRNLKIKLYRKIMTSCQAQACTHHLNNIPGFRSTTNYEGDDVDLEMEMVLMVVLVKMVLLALPPTPRRSWWRRWQRFPLSGGRGTAGFSFSRGGRRFSPPPPPQKIIRKIWRRVFSRDGELRKKGEPRRCSRNIWAQVARSGGWAAPPGLFWASWLPSCVSSAHGLGSDEKLSWYFPRINWGPEDP